MGCVGCCGGLGRCCVCFINVLLIVVFSVVLLLFTAIWIYPDIPLVLDMYEGEVLTEMKNYSLISIEDDWHITKCGLFPTFLYLVWAVSGLGLLLSICGCAGSCCKCQKCVCAYSIIVLLLVIVQTAVLILLPLDSNPYYTQIVKTVDPSFKQYGGIGGGTDDDNGWTFIMWKHECCGVRGYTESEDFLNSLSSKMSCCPPGLAKQNKCTSTNMYDVGCADALYQTSAGSGGYMAICPFLIGLQILLVLFGCCMVLKLQFNNKVSDELEERKPEKLPDKVSEKSAKDNVFAISYVY